MAYFSGYCHPNNQPEVRELCQVPYSDNQMDHEDRCECEKCDYESDESDSAILNCIVGQSLSLESGMYVEALPDSGCDMSTISEYMAMQIGVRVLRTEKKLFGATGAEIALAGQAIIFVKVPGVSTKRLKVLVETDANDALTIAYQDLITLRVLAPNFPNQVTNPEAPLLPHPYNNPKTTPLLTCIVYKKKHEKSPCLVDAVPDSGCSGRTNISRDFARRAGICVLPSHYPMRAASNTDMEVSGMALISICVKGQDKMIHRQVSVTNITDDMLLSWPDLISLGVLPGNFPRPAPEY